MNFEKIAIIGAGIMGHGIAQVMAQGSKQVILTDLSEQLLNNARDKIRAGLQLLAANNMCVPWEIEPALERIYYTTDLQAVADADLIIEVIPERWPLKAQLYKQLATISKKGAVWVSNTSGMPINKLAELTDRPELFAGLHFFMPAHLVPLVEVIQGASTKHEVIQNLLSLLTELGKSPVHVKMDIPGFIGNRLQHALAREAMSLLQKGVASAADIDTVVKTSLAMRLVFTGPLEQRDLNGLDTHLSIAEYLYADLENSTQPLSVLSDKVKAGMLGLKTGEGFYDWRQTTQAAVVERKNQQLIDMVKLLQSSKT